MSSIHKSKHPARQRQGKASGSNAALSAALVIDGNANTRVTLTGQLRSMGLLSVSQASKISDARRELERNPFDVVVCGDEFPKEGGSGQELLDDLRRSGLLPYKTVFVLLTNEPTYLKVAEAAESSVDSYLVKPYSVGSLIDRIEQARKRKVAMQPIYEALERSLPDAAISLSQQRFETKGPQWLQASRLGAEVMLRLGRFEEAETFFQAIWEVDPKPWAMLGVARAQLYAGSVQNAQNTLSNLLNTDPTYPEAYDVLGRVQMELGNFQASVVQLEKALQLTPTAIERLQRLGMLSFFCGDRDRAIELLERSTYLGLDSKMFDSECLVLLAMVAFAQDNPAQLDRNLSELRKRLRLSTKDLRLQRFNDLVGLLSNVQQGHMDEAAHLLNAACAQINEPAFDIEAACNLLFALSWLEKKGAGLLKDATVIDKLGRRFATSKAMGELLANAANVHTAYADRLKRSQDDIIQLIERSIKTATSGEPSTALKELFRVAKATLNAKAVESAWLVFQRYTSDIPEADQWQQQLIQLRETFGTARNKPTLGDPRLRQSGGVNLGPMDRLLSTPSA